MALVRICHLDLPLEPFPKWRHEESLLRLGVHGNAIALLRYRPHDLGAAALAIHRATLFVSQQPVAIPAKKIANAMVIMLPVLREICLA